MELFPRSDIAKAITELPLAHIVSLSLSGINLKLTELTTIFKNGDHYDSLIDLFQFSPFSPSYLSQPSDRLGFISRFHLVILSMVFESLDLSVGIMQACIVQVLLFLHLIKEPHFRYLPGPLEGIRHHQP